MVAFVIGCSRLGRRAGSTTPSRRGHLKCFGRWGRGGGWGGVKRSDLIFSGGSANVTSLRICRAESNFPWVIDPPVVVPGPASGGTGVIATVSAVRDGARESAEIVGTSSGSSSGGTRAGGASSAAADESETAGEREGPEADEASVGVGVVAGGGGGSGVERPEGAMWRSTADAEAAAGAEGSASGQEDGRRRMRWVSLMCLWLWHLGLTVSHAT